MTVPADAIGKGQSADDATADVVPADVDLGDVPDNAADLYRLLHREGVDEFTKAEAAELGADHGGALDASRASVNRWVNALADAGAVSHHAVDDPTEADTYRLE